LTNSPIVEDGMTISLDQSTDREDLKKAIQKKTCKNPIGEFKQNDFSES